jgi:diguanylate cyclase (GGDEF)-like protein
MSTKVLLIEDDPTVRLILTRRLKASGYEVVAAGDGVQALKRLRDDPVALIVSDWMMPNMDGIELCRRIKGDPNLCPNYFIMMTARGEKADCIEGLDAGADDYLPKPVDEGELIARLKVGERVLLQHRSLQDLADTDPLTCLRNRRSFEDDLESELKMMERYECPFSLLLMDFDDFKKVNDTWGHTKGDEALRLFAQFLMRVLRRSDHLYRIGGDEFAVILSQAEETEAEMTTHRLKELFDAFRSEHRKAFPFPMSFSIGSITAHPGKGVTREKLFQTADQRMYLDKRKPSDDSERGVKRPVARKGAILVVDDEPVTRKILQKGLSTSGYCVLIAEDGETCLDILHREKPDVLLLDWMLPGIDGMEVCRTIRSSCEANSPYIIMVTIVGGSKSRIEALDSGADDYINKPIDMDELLARVRVGMRMENMKAQIAGVEKLKGVMQMAGAAAHELSQPLTALMGLVDFMLMRTEKSDPNYERLRQIVQEAQRLGDLTKKIGCIMKYETKDYVGGAKIVDIERASMQEDPED